MEPNEINIADLVGGIEVGKSVDVRSYCLTLKAAIFNEPIVTSFVETLTIDKQTARKIYKRAYPKAKV